MLSQGALQERKEFMNYAVKKISWFTAVEKEYLTRLLEEMSETNEDARVYEKPPLLSDKSFWKIVDEAGWTKDHDYRRIKRYLMKEYDGKVMMSFAETAKVKVALLKQKLENYYGKAGNWSDVGFDDMLWHCVGSGEIMYEAISHLPKFAEQVDYKESFAYAIPSANDYKNNQKFDSNN